MSIRINTRGPKNGRCNICGAYGKLTEDHTPPKGCLKPTQVEIRHLVELLSNETGSTKGRLSQNGVKYRTICARCNNNFLGTKYDPELIYFVNSVGQLLRSPIHLPPVLTVRAKPQSILRSLVGHMSAQGVDRYEKGNLTEALRDYFLDPTLPLPNGLNAFYWAYPHRSHIMFRDAAYLDIRVGNPFAFWMLKFFPIAFMITWDKPTPLDHHISTFESWRNIPFDAAVDIPITLRPIPPVHWPETPTDYTMILYGQEAVYIKS